MDPARLKIGVMLDSLTVDRWVHGILEEIVASDFATLDCVILNAGPPRRRAFHQRLWTLLPIALYRLYEWLDRRLFREADDPLDAVDASGVCAGAARIEVVPVGRRWVQRFKREHLAQIRGRDLDVILRFGFQILRGRILESARHGVWSYHHGDNRAYRGGPPLFWEIYEGNPCSGSVLQILTEELDGGKVIYRSIGSTRMTSLHGNRKPIYRKSTAFVIRRLRDLHARGWDFITSLDTYGETIEYDRGIQSAPTNGVMLRYLLRLAWRIARNRVRLWSLDDLWFVAVQQKRPSGDAPWVRLEAPAGRFYADPFPVDDADGTWLFFEDCPLQQEAGVISCLRVGADGSLGPPRPALRGDCHLSYPFVFEWDGDHYMIPETLQSRSVELYRAVELPDRWERAKVLMSDVAAVDSTLLEHEGRFYLFVAMAEAPGSQNDELFVFHADTPLSEWRPHPLNPVVSDVQRARPAGRIYRSGDAWIRPGQDCSREYGAAVTLCRIDALSRSEYRETPVGRVEPDWTAGIRLTHTVNETPRLRVRDARARELRGLRRLRRTLPRR